MERLPADLVHSIAAGCSFLAVMRLRGANRRLSAILSREEFWRARACREFGYCSSSRPASGLVSYLQTKLEHLTALRTELPSPEMIVDALMRQSRTSDLRCLLERIGTMSHSSEEETSAKLLAQALMQTEQCRLDVERTQRQLSMLSERTRKK